MPSPWDLRGLSSRVLAGVLVVALAIALRVALLDILGPRTPFLTFYPGVMLAALLGGAVSGIIATAGLGLAAYLWVLPQLAPFILSEASWVTLGVFVASGLLVSVVAEGLLRARQRAARLEAEAALSAQRCELDAAARRLADLVESSSDAILGVDMQGIITSWNRGAEHIYGFPASEAVGRGVAELLAPPERMGEINDLLARIAAGEVVQSYETRRRRKDGSVLDVAVTLSPIRGSDCTLAGASAVVRDISDKKRAEEALRGSEERFREVVEGTDNLITSVDGQGRLLYVNPVAKRIFGLEPEQCLGRAAFDFVHPDDREATRSAFGLWVAEKRASANLENRQVSVTGQERFLIWNVNLHYGEDGVLTSMDSIAQDITELKVAELALREERERLATILNTSSDLMFLKDSELRYLAANAAHKETLGVDPAAVIGHRDEEFMAPEMAARCLESDRDALAFGSVLREEQILGRWYRVAKKRVADAQGRTLGVAGLISDITQDMLAFEALRESEERFRQLVENAPDGIFVQTEGRFAYVNRALLALYGASEPHQVLGQPVDARVHPDFVDQVRERIRQLNEERKPVPGLEMTHLRLDGSPVEVEVTAVPMAYGGKVGALAFLRDIGERKHLEALREDMERIARHDLKTPLNAVINLPLLMLDEDGVSPEHAEMLRMLHESGLRMLDQIDQSLTLYRIETKTFQLEPQPVDMPELLARVAADLSSMARSLGVEIGLEQGADAVVARGDALLCRTMLGNLLKNAVEATGRGGRVVVRLAVEQGEVSVEVQNPGLVPEHLRERFFEKYVSAGKRRGAGLGTYSARLSAEAQGGRISMQTGGQQGTVVQVWLPLWAEAPEQGPGATV